MNFISSYIRNQIMINLDKLDPDWQFAQTHAKANMAGSIPESKNEQKLFVCPCCYEHIDKQPVSLWENSKELQFLGFGYPLFYQYLKNCIILLILSICSYNALSIQQALISNYQLCHVPNVSHRLLAQPIDIQSLKTHCDTFMVEIARIEHYVTPNQQGMRIVSFVLHLLALIYIRNRIIKLQAYYDERTTSLSDYSVMVKGLPLQKGIQNSLMDFFTKQFRSKHEYQQITLLPIFDNIQVLEEKKRKLIDQLRKFYEKQQIESKNQQFKQKRLQLEEVQKELVHAANLAKQTAIADEMLCQKAICVFNTEREKLQILDQFKQITYQKKQLYFGENSSIVYIKEAPQPQQIIWQNANLSRRKRVLNILLGWGLSILVLTITFIVFYFILQKKSLILEESIVLLKQHPEQQHAQIEYRGALALVFLLMFLVVIFDKLALSTLFYKFTDLQRHSTTSKFQFSFALKLSLGLFFTTALMTLAVQAIRFHNYYTHPFGVIDQQTIMFFMNSFFVPFFWLLNPMRIKKLIVRKLKYGKKSLTQYQANQLMEQENYDMGKRFAQIVEIMWFTFLYSTLIPIGAVISCLGLIFYYWVDKYNLLRRSSVNGKISGRLINTSITLLDFTLILRPIGSIIFDSQIREFYMNSNIIMIVIAFVFIILPKDKIIQVFNNQKFNEEQKTYKEAQKEFHRTYHTQHPLLRIIYAQKHKFKMSEKNIQLSSKLINRILQNLNQTHENINGLVQS